VKPNGSSPAPSSVNLRALFSLTNRTAATYAPPHKCLRSTLGERLLQGKWIFPRHGKKGREKILKLKTGSQTQKEKAEPDEQRREEQKIKNKRQTRKQDNGQETTEN
jgi:hypothetical protein